MHPYCLSYTPVQHKTHCFHLNAAEDTLITQSLFSDKSATINEENIQRILEGSYKLPEHIRIAIVKLGAEQKRYTWDDEDFLKAQQSYIDLFADKLKQSPRVSKAEPMPDLLVSKNPSFTSIREAAVRMQADMVIVYSITGDVYSRNKFFAKQDTKAFATTQLILMDVRTGLIPFSTVVTKDYLSQKKKDELDYAETRSRIKN